MLLSVIIPTYNEAKRLPATLIDIETRLRAAQFNYEIIVVDNNSDDGTAAIAKQMYVFVAQVPKAGKGAAVRQGMLLAKGDLCLFTDADNATTIDHVYGMLPFFEEGYQAVIATRHHPTQPIYRQIAGKAGNLVIQALLLPGFSDTQCGFKAFTRKAAREIFLRCKIDGWAFDIEALTIALKLGYRIKQMPVHWIARLGSKVTPKAYLEVLCDTVRIWRHC